MASSLNTDPTLVRHLMGKLRKAGLLASTQGVARPRLTRDLGDISMLDVYNAVEPKQELLHPDTKTSKTCPVGSLMPDVISRYYRDIQNSAEARMRRVSLQDIMADLEAAQNT